jgi:hypothetical protein
MRRVTLFVMAVLLAAIWSGAALAGEPAAAPSKKSATAERLNSPRTTVGEVVEWTPGKLIVVKDDAGALHSYGLTKKTKVDGSLQTGVMISVVSTGRWAREIAVQPDPISPPGPQAKN